MALNPEIPLSAKTPNIGDIALDFQRLKMAKEDRERQKKLTDVQTKAAEQKLLDDRNSARLKSLAFAATQVKPFLEKNDIEGARQVLARRKESLKFVGYDSNDTDEFEKILNQDPAQALTLANSTLQAAQQFGIIKAPDEKFETVTDAKGNPIAQRSTTTGKIIEDPRKSKLLTPEELAQQKTIRAAGKTDISIDTKGATKEAEELGKLRAETLKGIQEKALNAEEQNVGLSQLENIDVKTGFGEEGKGQLARVFNAFGVNGNALTGVDPSNIQAFNAVSGKLVLDVMATQKGPQTDKDQERIAKTLPKIQNESLANKFTLNSLKAINFRRMEMRDFYENFLEVNGTLKGADREWAGFKSKTPLLSDNIKNPQTGLPMFFHEFKQKLIERNPGATDQQVINAWRELAK